MAYTSDSTPVWAAIAARPIVGRRHDQVDAVRLRARAARYRQLAEGLYDPRIIAEANACARELDAEAAWIEKQASFGARVTIRRYQIG